MEGATVLARFKERPDWVGLAAGDALPRCSPRLARRSPTPGHTYPVGGAPPRSPGRACPDDTTPPRRTPDLSRLSNHRLQRMCAAGRVHPFSGTEDDVSRKADLMPSPFSVDGSYSFLGERHPAVDGQTLDVISPVDGSLVGRVHEFTPQEIDAVYASAVKNQVRWRDTSLDDRARILGDVADFLDEAVEPLAELITMEVARAPAQRAAHALTDKPPSKTASARSRSDSRAAPQTPLPGASAWPGEPRPTRRTRTCSAARCGP